MSNVMLPLRRNNPSRASAIWTKCAPFVENSRGRLIHRPREVTTYNLHRTPHIAVHHWCGAAHTGWRIFTFLQEPPQNKLLCERCELMAVAAGLPDADLLAGRHVHRGKLLPIQTCCQMEAP